MTSTHQILSFKLDKSEKFNGDNWVFFEMAMLTEGNTHDLVNYWENKVTIPGQTLAPLPSTPINSLTLNLLEYVQHKSVALVCILCNVKNVFGLRLNPCEPSHKAWDHLKSQYSDYSDLV